MNVIRIIKGLNSKFLARSWLMVSDELVPYPHVAAAVEAIVTFIKLEKDENDQVQGIILVVTEA